MARDLHIPHVCNSNARVNVCSIECAVPRVAESPGAGVGEGFHFSKSCLFGGPSI